MPNGGWNPRIPIRLKASTEKSTQDNAWKGYIRPQELRLWLDLPPKNKPKPHRKNPKMLILLRASFNQRHTMDVGTINWNPKVCISPRASSGKNFRLTSMRPNASSWLEELLTFTCHHSPEPQEYEFRNASWHAMRGVVWVYCEQKLMATHTSRKATHLQYIQSAIPWY